LSAPLPAARRRRIRRSAVLLGLLALAVYLLFIVLSVRRSV